MTEEYADERIIKALGHPLRRRILATLDERTASPKELSVDLDQELGVVSYHVRILRELGLLELTGQRQKRGAIESHYRSRARPRPSSASWGSLSPSVREGAWGRQVQELLEQLEAAESGGGLQDGDSLVRVESVHLDAEGRRALARAVDAFWKRADAIVESADNRATAGKDGKNGKNGKNAATGLGIALLTFRENIPPAS